MIVKDDHMPRGQWKLGIVQEIMSGRDGLTRAATVKVVSRDRQQSMLRRPIQLLYPLEIHCESVDTSPTEPTLDPKTPKSQPELSKQARPRRAAAKRADEMRREWIAELEGSD